MDRLKKLRGEIDSIDDQILRLVEKRREIAGRIGRLKKQNGLEVYDPVRENKIIEKACKNTRLDAWFVRRLFCQIIEYCRSGEKKSVNAGAIKKTGAVAVLGPAGTFTEKAAKRLFKENKLEYCDSVEEVFKSVESGTEYGVVAIENSLEGSISKTLECLLEYDLMICGETVLDIRLSLMASHGTRKENVNIVLSHPHALAQCSRYLKENFPNATLQGTASTTSAMKDAGKINGAAAVGFSEAAKDYGLVVLDDNVQDDASQTRFIVLSKSRMYGPKTSIIFAVKDQPGALYAILNEFADRKINLSKIESRPSRRLLGEYLFFMDFDSSKMSEIEAKKVLEDIKPMTTLLKFLGSY